MRGGLGVRGREVKQTTQADLRPRTLPPSPSLYAICSVSNEVYIMFFDYTPQPIPMPQQARDEPRTFGDRVELLSRHIDEEGGVKAG